MNPVAGRRSPVAEALADLASRRVILVGGKGGVGKTTIAAAAALLFSETRKTILFTTDPASNLDDLFAPATGDRRPATLTIESLNAQQLYENFLDQNLANFLELGDRGTYLDKEELQRLFELSIPGVDELMAWMHIGELAESNRDSMIVVDTAPTGHTLRMLGSGDHFRQLAIALDTMQEKHRDLVRQLARRNMRDAIDDFLDNFAEQAKRRRELLHDAERAAFVPVFLSEPWVVEQTKRLIGDVQMDVPFAVLNRVDPCGHAKQREQEAREALAPLAVVDASRSCVPLDSVDGIDKWLTGTPPRSAATGREPPAVVGGAPLSIRRITFLAGKGGVGKTTCSASIALQLAQQSPGKKFTVISVDPAHSLRDVFAHEAPPSNLAVEFIDTRAKWRQFRDSLGAQIERAIDALTPSGVSIAHDTEAMRQLIEIAPPGADELFAIDRLSDLIRDDSQDRIIVDTAPTGHFLRLIDLPKTAGDWVREFMRILLRYREVLPAGSLGEELLRASRALHRVDETLRSLDCAIIVVTRPERVVLAETQRLIADIERRGIQLGGVIANYVTPSSDCDCDRQSRAHEAESLRALGPAASIIERRDAPVTTLADLRTLVAIQSR